MLSYRYGIVSAEQDCPNPYLFRGADFLRLLPPNDSKSKAQEVCFMKEKWRKIEEYQDYSVSNLGRVRRDNLYHNSNKDGMLKLMNFAGKYKRVSLSKNNQYKNNSVHRLVARAFIGIIPKGYHVNHIDANPSNNRVKNLEIVTPQENVAHQVKIQHVAYGDKNVNAKFKNKDIKKIREIYSKGIGYSNIAKLCNVSLSTIASIIKGKTWDHVKNIAKSRKNGWSYKKCVAFSRCNKNRNLYNCVFA